MSWQESLAELCSSMKSVIFEQCELSQFNFDGIRLLGEVRLGKETKITQAQFYGLEAAAPGQSPKITLQDDTGDLRYCIWDSQSFSVLDFTRYMPYVTSKPKVRES